MSFLTGPIAGALVAGSVYYGFSSLIQRRTEYHRRDLHALSVRLVETPVTVQAPPAAAARIKANLISAQVKENWNRDVETLFRGFQSLDRSVMDWGRDLLYGSPEPSKEKTSSPALS